MKKILLLLLAITFNLSQGQTYTINSQLRLNTVHEGTSSDSILVRGADKIIKYIPKSSILGSVSNSAAMFQSSGVPYGNSLVDAFLAENLGREILYYDNSAGNLYAYDYAASDWINANKDQLDLKVIDSYNGTRLAPKDPTLNGYFISKQANQNVGFYAENTDDSGNAAQASLTVKGSGALYSNYIGMSYYNANYYVTSLRNTGAIYSDKPISLMTWNSNPIDFRTGSAFASTTSKFKINGDGQLVVGVAPTTNNTVNSLLGRDTSGNIVTVTNALISTATVPTSSTSLGTKGQIAFDANFAYICTATNTWGRFPLTTTF